MLYKMLYNMLYNIYLQLGVLPELDAESLGLFTASERILQDFAETKHVVVTSTLLSSRISSKKFCITQTLILLNWTMTPACTSGSWAL